MNLTREQHQVMTRLNRAGAGGLPLGDDGCPIGMALHFSIYGMVVITNAKASPQRAVITQRGRSFLTRAAA